MMPESRRQPGVHSPSWLLGKTPPRRYEDWQLGTSARETTVVLRTQVPWSHHAQQHLSPSTSCGQAWAPLSLGRCTHPQLWEKIRTIYRAVGEEGHLDDSWDQGLCQLEFSPHYPGPAGRDVLLRHLLSCATLHPEVGVFLGPKAIRGFFP